MATPSDEVSVSARISAKAFAKIQQRRRAIRSSTGIEPSVSAIVRLMIEEAPAVERSTKSIRKAG